MITLVLGIDTTESLRLVSEKGERPAQFTFEGDCFEATAAGIMAADVSPVVLRSYLSAQIFALKEALEKHFGLEIA